MRGEVRGRAIRGAKVGRRALPGAALALALTFLSGDGLAAEGPPASEPGSGWLRVDYGRVLDRRQLSHSGDSVGELLRGLAERGALDAPDPVTLNLLDPLLEPYAFVLQDFLDSRAPMPDPPMVELGQLWVPGQAQPAWVELLRARRYLVESDGAGRMRVCLPWQGETASPERPAGEALREAATAAWPVLRHLFAAEQRRLARSAGLPPEERPLLVEAHVYRHDPGRSVFFLGEEKLDITVVDTRAAGNRPPLDLESISGFLASGLQLEGARLEPDGSLRLLGSAPERRPTLLGRPLALSDFAVAYRAVFHGGYSEPYMSLDRGWSPQTSIVNYGGRLRDTAPGLVSLLCDIRFKTFSLGLDIESGRDLRTEIREEVPTFRSHLERFASDPQSRGVLAQQTRLWFYPDSVDLTVSPQGDLLAFRRVRMTASSERVLDRLRPGATAEDPPWTRATVEAINRDYDGLSRTFPELADLDQVVRLLSLFTWLRQAEADGLLLPDLDVLLALELPPLPTPRRYPQLLSFNALPPVDREGEVLAFDRVPVGAALDRLSPASGRPLAARRRLARAMAALDPDHEQNAELLAELRAMDLDRMDESLLDRLTSRVERLRMHQLVLSTLERERREELVRRSSGGDLPRIFSVGIGGLDLGMSQAVTRARGRSLQLGALGAARSAGAAGISAVAQAGPAASARRTAASEPRDEWRRDSPLVPDFDLPDHGLDAGRQGRPGGREFGAHRIETGVEPGSSPDEAAGRWVRILLDADGPEARGRTVRLDSRGLAREIERFEDGRLIRYRFEGEGGDWSAVPEEPRGASPAAPSAAPPAELPEGLATLAVVSGGPSGGGEEPPAVRLRLRGAGPAGGRPLEAEFPRSLLQRIVLGREADPTPDRPLPGFDPLPEPLGQVRTLMVLAAEAQRRPPWEAPAVGLAGEEDPARLARALGAWWSDPETGAVRRGAVVGTDPEQSAERWRSAPRPRGAALLLLPDDGFPGPSAPMRAKLREAWAGPVAGELPAGSDAGLIVLVSAEAPGLFAARLRDLARRPEMQGKLLAAWCLSGPVRQDLPASLLAEGRLAGLGLAESTVVGRREAVERLAALGRSASGSRGEARVERMGGPFLWFF